MSAPLRCGTRATRAARATRDEGNVTLLSLGLVILLLSLILVVASATAVQLTRVRLLHLADELALDAADAADLDAYYAGTAAGPDVGEGAVLLAEERMQDAVLDHLAGASDRHGVEGASVVEVVTTDGSTATVRLQVTVDPLFGVSALLPFADGITLNAESSARAS